MVESLASQMAALILVVGALLTLHELAHVAIARAYGYPMICVGISPLAVGIVFLDQPLRRYWVLQVTVPLAVTAAVAYLGLFGLPLSASGPLVVVPFVPQWQMGLSVLLAMLTSSGDLASMVLELRRPVWGRDRVVRDVRLLRRVGSFIRFTAFGRRYLAEEFGQSPRDFVSALDRPHATTAA